MKRGFRLLAAILASAALLAGCSSRTEDQTITCEDLTITLPENYVNLSHKDYASDMAFVYGVDQEAVLAIKQDRASLEAHYPGITPLEFAQIFVDKAQLSSTVSQQDGLVSFLYTADVGGTSVTYLSGVYRTDRYFWVVQFYCPTADYGAKQADFLRYLQSVQAVSVDKSAA